MRKPSSGSFLAARGSLRVARLGELVDAREHLLAEERWSDPDARGADRGAPAPGRGGLCAFDGAAGGVLCDEECDGVHGDHVEP